MSQNPDVLPFPIRCPHLRLRRAAAGDGPQDFALEDLEHEPPVLVGAFQTIDEVEDAMLVYTRETYGSRHFRLDLQTNPELQEAGCHVIVTPEYGAS